MIALVITKYALHGHVEGIRVETDFIGDLWDVRAVGHVGHGGNFAPASVEQLRHLPRRFPIFARRGEGVQTLEIGILVQERIQLRNDLRRILHPHLSELVGQDFFQRSGVNIEPWIICKN